jgi:hypothetical protein
VEEILGLIVDALRKRGAPAGGGNLAPPPQVAPRVVPSAAAAPGQAGNTSAEIAAAIQRANAADAPPRAAVAPSAPRAPTPPRAPAPPPRPAAVPRAAMPGVPVAPAPPPRLLAAFGDASAFLQAFVVSEALAPPVTLRPPSH